MKTAPPLDVAESEEKPLLSKWKIINGWSTTMDDVQLEKKLMILDPNRFSSAAGWSFSLDSNMKTPAWISGMKAAITGFAPAACCHCGTREMKQLFLD